MSTNISNITDEKMVSVPEWALQCLIWNCGIAVAGMGKGEEVVAKQCRILQNHIDGIDPDFVDVNDGFTLEEFSLDDPLIKEFENVEFVDFRSPR